jgi:hypothetical protein
VTVVAVGGCQLPAHTVQARFAMASVDFFRRDGREPQIHRLFQVAVTIRTDDHPLVHDHRAVWAFVAKAQFDRFGSALMRSEHVIPEIPQAQSSAGGRSCTGPDRSSWIRSGLLDRRLGLDPE